MAKGSDPDVVRIFDTTLRDGEQAPGIALTRAEKVEIAEQLARLQVDVIEAGFPVSSEGEFEAVSEIASSVKGPVIAALARVVPGDITRAAEALGGAERCRTSRFACTPRCGSTTIVGPRSASRRSSSPCTTVAAFTSAAPWASVPPRS